MSTKRKKKKKEESSFNRLQRQDMTMESKPGAVKFKSSGQDGSSKGKSDFSAKGKNLIRSSSKQQSADPKVKSISTVTTKTEVKSKTTPSSSKITTTTTKVKEKKEKKVYSLPGQKYDPPEEREPLRIFYESLSTQIPESEMAEFWMMEHGLLSPKRAKKAFEKKQRKQKQLRTGTPIKSPPPLSSKLESSQKQQQASKNGDVKTKRKIKDSDEDDDFILSPKRRKG